MHLIIIFLLQGPTQMMQLEEIYCTEQSPANIQTPQCSWNQMHQGGWEGLQDYKDVEYIWPKD
jgi:hypothetical protein